MLIVTDTPLTRITPGTVPRYEAFSIIPVTSVPDKALDDRCTVLVSARYAFSLGTFTASGYVVVWFW